MKNPKRYRVRFHLANGENYMKWQVFDKKRGTKEYLDPESNSVIMFNCELGNREGRARKIFEGANKNVCAWVACEDVEVRDRDKVVPPLVNGMTQYKYNPRKNPHWFTDTHDNMDGKKFSVMMTHDRKIYA